MRQSLTFSANPTGLRFFPVPTDRTYDKRRYVVACRESYALPIEPLADPLIRKRRYTMQHQMNAVGIRKFGSIEVLEQMSLPIPILDPKSILVRIAATGINPADWRFRNGQFKFLIRKFPFIPGADVAGIVEAVGKEVTRFKVGDAIFAMLPLAKGGGYAEYVAISESDAALIPDNLTFIEAAAVPLAGLTAHKALTDKAAIRAGDEVLIYGASGGVGTFAVQIAKALGAHVVGVASGRNAELIHSLGADKFIDYTQANILSSGKRYPIIFDAMNVYSFNKWRNLLSPKGILVSVNPVAGNPLAALTAGLQGFRVSGFLIKPNGAALEQVAQYLRNGQVRSIIDKVYLLEEAGKAQQASEAGHTRGKSVLTINTMLADKTIHEYKSRS